MIIPWIVFDSYPVEKIGRRGWSMKFVYKRIKGRVWYPLDRFIANVPAALTIVIVSPARSINKKYKLVRIAEKKFLPLLIPSPSLVYIMLSLLLFFRSHCFQSLVSLKGWKGVWGMFDTVSSLSFIYFIVFSPVFVCFSLSLFIKTLEIIGWYYKMKYFVFFSVEFGNFVKEEYNYWKDIN